MNAPLNSAGIPDEIHEVVSLLLEENDSLKRQIRSVGVAASAMPPDAEFPRICVPVDLHPDTKRLVVDFATALGAKLLASQVKYGFENGWLSPEWRSELIVELIKHIGKGDPRDVAAFCAFAWYHQWSVRPVPSPGLLEWIGSQLKEIPWAVQTEETKAALERLADDLLDVVALVRLGMEGEG